MAPGAAEQDLLNRLVGVLAGSDGVRLTMTPDLLNDIERPRKELLASKTQHSEVVRWIAGYATDQSLMTLIKAPRFSPYAA